MKTPKTGNSKRGYSLMTKIGAVLAVAALSGAAGYGIAERQGWTGSPAVEAVYESAPATGAMSKTRALNDRTSQTYGTICSTSRGECTVSRKPLNSSCSCGDAEGRIIR